MQTRDAMTLWISERFRGPPKSGNGGYVCGLLSRYVPPRAADAAIEVTLRAPAPLGQSMSVKDDAGVVSLMHGETLIAQAKQFAASDGTLPSEIVWTALDCPRQMAWLALGGRSGGLLGRMTARIVKPARAGERNVVIGWTMGSEGRKFYSGTALFDAHGTLCAYAQATWIGRT
jgi:hypothetical protein